jgi:general L-amino acid transport system substrate-binding protein
LIGLHFSGVSYYDGQGFMVPVDMGIQSALELDKVSICVEPPGRDLANLDTFFTTHSLDYKIIQPARDESVGEAVEAGRCPVVSGDVSRLAALRIQLSSPERYMMLPELISRRPIGPVVRQGDDGWFNIMRWVMFGLVVAEEKGLTSGSIDLIHDPEDPEVRSMLGLEGDIGLGLGLNGDWLYQMVKQVGNYGEIFDRNLGHNSELNMERNINELWNRGGLHYGASLH